MVLAQVLSGLSGTTSGTCSTTGRTRSASLSWRKTAKMMTPGYSKLVIFEWVLLEKMVPSYSSLLDVNMMAVANGSWRPEGQRRAWLRVPDWMLWVCIRSGKITRVWLRRLGGDRARWD